MKKILEMNLGDGKTITDMKTVPPDYVLKPHEIEDTNLIVRQLRDELGYLYENQGGQIVAIANRTAPQNRKALLQDKIDEMLAADDPTVQLKEFLTLLKDVI